MMINKGFSKLDNPNHEGKTNTWLTPLDLIYKLGGFDLDPCGYKEHHTASNLIVLPENGLEQEWKGRVWLNPPYGKNIGIWLRKLKKHANGIALVFSRTDTEWFQNSNADAYFFIKGRIKFINPCNPKTTNAGHGSCFMIFGEENIESVLNSGIEGNLLIQKR